MAIVGFLVAVLGSLTACALAYILGRRGRVLDLPDAGLKTHDRAVVPLGGAGVMVGLHLGLVVADAFDPALLVATLLMWVIGLIDDIRGLSPITRLIGAGLAGVALAGMSDPALGAPVFIFWVVATIVVVNAVNLLDGMDGLAGSVALAALVGLWVFSVAQDAAGPVLFVVAVGAILGSLFWNLPPARMFLGDNGAYVVAVTLTWAAMQASPDSAASLVGVALIGVPLLDLGVTVTRRLVSRRPLFAGDRDHTYDRMAAAGHPVARIVAVFVLAQLVWATALILPALLIGDLAAALTALVLGAVTVLVLVSRAREAPA